MNFNILLIGSKPESFYLEAIKEYAKRLNRYGKINIFVCKDSRQLPAKVLHKSYCLNISSGGEAISSEQLALKLERLALGGISDVTFIVGADVSESTEEAVKAIPYADSLTLSSLTMAPGLQAVLLVEQLYRAHRILRHEPYHK